MSTNQVYPSILYHGTSFDYVDSIEHNGLTPHNYEHVYSTADIKTAYEYASRFDKPVICIIDSQQMLKDGFVFYDIENEWLTERIPSKYLLQILVEDVSDLSLIENYAKEASRCYNEEH